MPNSWHKAVKDFSPRLAVTTKLTRCSRTSIVFHGIDQYAPALAALAPECKGCLETFRKGSHGTEHKERKGGPATMLPLSSDITTPRHCSNRFVRQYP